MSGSKPLVGELGIVGWLCRGRRGIEGYMYLLHRLTGLILLLFVTAHIILSSSLLLGQEVWAQMMQFALSPTIQAFKYVLLTAFAFHAFNGIRLILIEMGLAVGRAEQQVYPYRGSIRKQRPLLIAMMVLTGVLLVAGEFDVLRLAH